MKLQLLSTQIQEEITERGAAAPRKRKSPTTTRPPRRPSSRPPSPATFASSSTKTKRKSKRRRRSSKKTTRRRAGKKSRRNSRKTRRRKPKAACSAALTEELLASQEELKDGDLRQPHRRDRRPVDVQGKFFVIEVVKLNPEKVTAAGRSQTPDQSPADPAGRTGSLLRIRHRLPEQVGVADLLRRWLRDRKLRQLRRRRPPGRRAARLLRSRSQTPPAEAENLLALQRARIELRLAGAESVELRGGRLSVLGVELDSAGASALSERVDGALYEWREKTASVRVPDDPAARLAAVLTMADALRAASSQASTGIDMPRAS